MVSRSRSAVERLRRLDLVVVFSILLLIASLAQLRIVFAPERILQLKRVWSYRDLPSEARGAIFFAGTDFRGYIDFVKDVVPEEGTVILPRVEQAGHFGHAGIMGYFLIPRRLINCGSTEFDELERCVGNVQDPNTYVLAVGAFPPPELATRRLDYLPYNDDLGIYVPR